MSSTSYRRIDAVDLACQVIEFLAGQKEPVAGQAVAAALGKPHATVMCHLVTLEDRRFVRRIGDGYELGFALALFWARKKSQLEATRERIDRELQSIALEGGA